MPSEDGMNGMAVWMLFIDRDLPYSALQSSVVVMANFSPNYFFYFSFSHSFCLYFHLHSNGDLTCCPSVWNHKTLDPHPLYLSMIFNGQ